MLSDAPLYTTAPAPPRRGRAARRRSGGEAAGRRQCRNRGDLERQLAENGLRNELECQRNVFKQRVHEDGLLAIEHGLHGGFGNIGDVDGQRGVASLGVRPMFGENTPNIETFIFDFSGDLYGEHLSVALIEWLRPELKFDSLDALIARMDADCARARDILDTLPA